MHDPSYPVWEIRFGYPGVIISGGGRDKPEHWRERDFKWALFYVKNRAPQDGSIVRVYTHGDKLIETHIFELQSRPAKGTLGSGGIA